MARRYKLLLFIFFLGGMRLAIADGGGGSDTRAIEADRDFSSGVSAIKRQDFPEAIERLESYLSRNPNDADGWNWVGFAYRKSGKLNAAFPAYDKALKIDPKHRGAHEYLGEAYLLAGNPAKAAEQLKILDKLCFLPCEEYSDLKQALAAYQKKTPK